MTRRLLVILLSPLWLVLALLGLLAGLAVFSGSDPARIAAVSVAAETAEGEQIAYLIARLLLLPFQLIFIALVIGAALWVFRRRGRLGAWVLGDTMAERLAGGPAAEELPSILQPDRRRTLRQLFASAIATLTIFLAAVLILGQFVARADLAVIVAALISSLTWGARLPIADMLGGLSNIFENSLAVGDRIQYRQVDRIVDGVVEAVDLRFLSVRALSGELTTIPFGELRIFRNFSRGATVGVYAIFPIAAADLSRAVALLNDLAPQSPALVTQLAEPWQPMSLEGRMGAIIDLYLFGKTAQGNEDDLQLALHAFVQRQLVAAGIPLAAPGGATP